MDFSIAGLSLTKTLEPHSHSISAVPIDFSRGFPHLMHLYTFPHRLHSGLRQLRCVGSAGELVMAVSAFPDAVCKSFHLSLLAGRTGIEKYLLAVNLIPCFSYGHSVPGSESARGLYLCCSLCHMITSGTCPLSGHRHRRRFL